MQDNVRPLRERGGDSEKLTINIGYVDLGRVDLLVREGFYSNRTDFIRTAIRTQLATHAAELRQFGPPTHPRAGPAPLQPSTTGIATSRAAGELLHIKVLGLARIASATHNQNRRLRLSARSPCSARCKPALRSRLHSQIVSVSRLTFKRNISMNTAIFSAAMLPCDGARARPPTWLRQRASSR